MRAADRVPNREHVIRLQRFARERANVQARRVPWQRLLEAREQYIDWQEFYLWVRTALEVENRIPEWIAEILKNRCPGFLETQEDLSCKAATNLRLALRLEDWIDAGIFDFAKQEGWFNAILIQVRNHPRNGWRTIAIQPRNYGRSWLLDRGTRCRFKRN